MRSTRSRLLTRLSPNFTPVLLGNAQWLPDGRIATFAGWTFQTIEHRTGERVVLSGAGENGHYSSLTIGSGD